MRLNHQDVVNRLRGYGLKFTSASVFTEGRYTPEDAIWNYKDAMAHIPHIHHLVQNVPVHNHRDSLASVFVQRIFGLRFPIVVYDYEATQHTQTAISALFFFVLVIHNVCEEVSPGITRVTTHYHVGATRPFCWLAPLVIWTLKRNYQVLTSTDIPLRERRGQLRSWGYDFVVSDYLTAEDIRNDNVQLPANSKAPSGELDLNGMQHGEVRLWGQRSDHYGLRFLREQNSLLVHSRMCSHEGAALDEAPCPREQVQCPWHGRALKPLAKFDLTVDTVQSQSTPIYHLLLKAGVLSLRPSTRPEANSSFNRSPIR